MEGGMCGAPIPSHVIWVALLKMMVGRKSVSTTWGNWGAPMTYDQPVKKLGQGIMFTSPNFFTGGFAQNT